MQIKNPSRLIIAVLVVALIVVAVVVVLSSGSSNPTAPITGSKTTSVIHLKAQAAPKGIQAVIDATNKVNIIKTVSTGVGGTTTEYVERNKAIDSRFLNGKLSLLKLGSDVYGIGTTASCYVHGTSPIENPNIANEYLPSGVAGFGYTNPSATTIKWSATGSKGTVTYSPKTDLMTGATITNGAPKPQVTHISYPASLPARASAVPKDLCASGTK